MILNSVKYLLLLVFYGKYLNAQNIVLEIPDGRIRGRIETTPSQVTFYVFQGIPFAKPPINNLRFQAPQPVEPWDGVIDATHEKNICYQVSNDRPDENEDCLFIHVYTPKDLPTDGSLLPVMFFIYPGGFVGGSPDYNFYGPQHFIDNGVILVSFNYRLGPFGFLSTGDSAIPGNAGLKDQNLALQWVNKNIKYFGGDATKVTIYGASAGGASVAYHILSPKSKGLFRAGICGSGSAISPWAYQRDQVKRTYQTAALINPAFNNGNGTTTELLQFLLSVPARDIDKASYDLSLTETPDYIQMQQGFFYAPVVEHDHEDAFITKLMYESLKDGDFNKVPALIGFNSQEALFFADDSSKFKTQYQAFDTNHKLLIPLDMKVADESSKVKVGEEIKTLYAPGSSFEQNPTSLIKYLSDQCFIRSAIKHAELQSAYTDVFFYQFSYTGIMAGHADQPVIGFSDQVRHGEEQNYLFMNVYTTDLSQFPESDVSVLKRFTKMFTNFAKTLNPTPEEDALLENIIWPKVNATDFLYVDIGSYSLIRLHPRSDTYDKWGTIYEEYGVPPYDTY